MDSYGKFMELAMNPKETGAYLRQSIFYFKEKVNVDLTRPSFTWISLHVLLLVRNDILTVLYFLLKQRN